MQLDPQERDELEVLRSSFESQSNQYLEDYARDLIDEGSYGKAQIALALLIERSA